MKYTDLTKKRRLQALRKDAIRGGMKPWVKPRHIKKLYGGCPELGYALQVSVKRSRVAK